MRFTLFILFVILVLPKNSLSQTFEVVVSGYSGAATYSPYRFTINGPFGTMQSSGGNFVVASIPTSFSIEFRNGSGNSCTQSGTVSNPSSYCASGSSTFTSCGGGGSTGGIGLGTRPLIAFESGTTASDSYCQQDAITLVGTSGFVGYGWQYQVESGGWQSFNPGSASTVTFGIHDIFGSSYASNLNKEIYFRYTVGGCGNSGTVGPYTFRPTPALVNSSSVTNPLCYNSAGIFAVSDFSRDPVFEEVFDLTVRKAGDPLGIVQQIHDIAEADLPVTFTGITLGDYEVYIEGFIPNPSNPSQWIATGCGSVQYNTFTIVNPTQVTFTNAPGIPSCHINTIGIKNDGSIIITATGGTGSGYTYSKDNGSNYQSGNILSGLAEGRYDVIVKDGNGCASDVSPIVVGQPPDITQPTGAVTSDYNGQDISCVSSTNGQITVSSSGGTGTLTYSKDGSNYQVSNVFTGLGAGNYTLTVKDNNGCTKISSVVPVVAPPAIVGTVTPTSATCNGISNGKIDVISPSGGTGTLNYSIDGSTFQSGTSFTGLSANNYTVTIRDQNACTATINTTVTQPPAIGVTGMPTLVTCFGGSDGTVKITASNAVGTPMYSLNGSAFQTSDTFTGLAANTYTLAVRDGNSCLGNGNVTITSNPIISSSITSTPISCNGGNNGALNLTPGGGVGPYTFSWSNGQTTEDIGALTAGTYTVTITDSKLCQQSFNRILTQPLPVTASYTTSDYNGSGVSCFGSTNGSINLTPAGGNGGYTYLWSNSSTAEDLNSLPAGIYTVTITDNKSCTGNQSITITQPAQLITTISGQHIACFGGNTGSITLNTTGGTTTPTSYQYSINGGTSWQSTPTFTNRTAGSYTVLTRDVNNCSDTDNITLTSPTDIVLTVSDVINTTCNQSNGSAQASATGGVSNYTYNWYNSSNTQINTTNTVNNLAAGIYRVVVTDQNSCTKQQNVTISSSDGPSITTTLITAASCSNTTDGTATISITQGQAPYTILWPNNQTTATATNLAGGDYIVQVRDNSNCLALQTVTVPAPPELIIQTVTQQNPNCNNSSDGQITVNAQGGNGTYSYSWNTGSTNSTITNLTAGTYTVTAKDIKNCQTIQQYTLTNPPIFTIDLGADESICEGQTITKALNINNATYEWTGPDSFTSTQQQISISQPGTYTLTVTNQSGCEATDSFTLSINTDLLKADFLMVSEAFAGDTVIVIDISWPIPTSVNWQFETGAIIIDQTPDYALVRYDEPGTYNTTLQAQLAQCVSTHSQSLIILEKPNTNSGGREGRGVIREFSIYPNPVNEKLNAVIELEEEGRVLIELYHLNSNKRVLVQQLDDEAYYQTELELNHLMAGIYVIVVKAGNEVKSVKVIKM